MNSEDLRSSAEEPNLRPPAWLVGGLLFGSGMCALIYQVAWLRAMRLIFGASTAASAAVLAIFMAGLGIGGILLGRRADRHPRPLVFYAHLELAIAIAAALTPALIWMARQSYIALGGTVVLGLGGATVVRLFLASLVLCVPTILMGGTLPAAARAVETDEDVGRRNVAFLYGANTVGAVTGALLSSFIMLEALGTRKTLWLACLVNLIVAILARIAAPAGAATPAAEFDATEPATAAPTQPFALVAAATVGFAFLLMELVWYRMLAPLLGGSSYTFGLVLAVALLGIGLGGVGYGLRSNRPARLSGFAFTCTLEAMCLAVPFAIGDRLAFLAMALRTLGQLGFFAMVCGWAIVAALVVLPAALVAGVQFPLLIALLGRGRTKVGRHVGQVYAWNTGGAILGSLAGGFGLVPVLTAPGTWQLVIGILVALGVSAALLSFRAERRLVRVVPTFLVAGAALMLLAATGPTAVWRHSAVGAGRGITGDLTVKSRRDFTNRLRRSVRWQADGVESAVALTSDEALAFIVNGKSDGNAISDAPTQVMGGLIGAVLHPHPTSALVIGLGTGSTAGWLGAVAEMERVDVVELEPAIVEVARACTAVNHDVLINPKVHLSIGDAREVLLTTPQRYDIIFSEPSNPYRAGVAGLFTQEFYRTVAAKLTSEGIFLQWVQTYEADVQTIQTIYATMTSVFPVVESWETQPGDLILAASLQPIKYDVPSLSERVRREPFRTALAVSWRAVGLEGLLSRYVADASFARAVAQQASGPLNTDDQTPIEFAFARTVGQGELFRPAELVDAARRRHQNHPPIVGGTVDWDRAKAQRDDDDLLHAPLKGIRDAWRAKPHEPQGLLELALLAEALADAGDDTALEYIEHLRGVEETEADIVLARLFTRQRRYDLATEALTTAFTRHQTDPWPSVRLVYEALLTAENVAANNSDFTPQLYQSLSTPFAVANLNLERQLAVIRLASSIKGTLCADAFAAIEPYIPWDPDLLGLRLRCYERAGLPMAAQAKRDLNLFLREAPARFTVGAAGEPG